MSHCLGVLPDGFEKLGLEPRREQIAVALDWLEAQVERLELPPRAAFGLSLSVDEALANVMLHAFESHAASGDAEQTPALFLCLGRIGSEVQAWICDNGPAFDPTRQQLRELADSLDEAELGGHGLRLMRHYLKSMDYARKQGWNILMLTALDAGDSPSAGS